jgi:hypothetical protein
MKNKKEYINKVIDLLLMFILCLTPVVLSVGIFSPDDLVHPIMGAQVSLADLLILVVFVIWSIQVLQNRTWTKVKLPPKAIFAFMGVIALSFLNAPDTKSVLKEILQSALYLFVFYTILLSRIQTRDILKKAFFILIGITTVVTIFAFYQAFVEQGSPYLIRGLFSNRNLLGGFFVIMLPLFYAFAIVTKKRFLKAFVLFLISISFLVIYSPFAVISVVASLIIMSFFYSKKSLWAITLFLLMITITITFSSKHQSVWKNELSIYEQGSIGANYNRVQRLLYDLPKNIWLQKYFGDKVLTVKNDLFISSVEPQTRTKVEKYSHLEDQQHIKQRYIEWQAALNMVAVKPVIGFGAGIYQMFIGNHYGVLPKVNTMEPNSENLYLLVASTMGVLGLAMLLWIVLYHLSASYKLLKNAKDQANKIIGLAGIGSFWGIIVYSFFTSFMVAGLLPYVVLMAACIHGNVTKIKENNKDIR